MQAAFLYKEQIKDDIIFLSQTKKQKGSERNILNKWFQDSIKNYFLETYASPFLKNELGEGFVKKVKQNIEKRMQSDGLKFMNLLNQYKIELEAFGKAAKFVNSLISIVIDDQKLERGSALWAKQAKKKFVALMLIVLMEYNESRVSSFYDMWNYIFPSETQIKKKLSKDDKLRLKCVSQMSTTSSLKNSPPLTQRSLLSPVNSNTTTRYHYKHINQPLQQQNTLIRTFPDSSSQCSRACDFQDLDSAQVIKKFQLETKQEAEQFYQNNHQQIFHHPYHIQQSHQNQNQHQITQHQPAQFQFVTTQPFNALKGQEIVLRQAQNQPNLAQHSTQIGNATFINNPDILRRMSTVFSIKQDITDSEMINLDDQQFFIDRQDDANSAISVQPPNYSQTSQFSFEPHSIFQNLQHHHHQQPQVQHNTFKYPIQEHTPQPHGNQIGLTVHLTNQPAQLTTISQQPTTGQSHGSSNGYFYSNNVDMNSYFNVDQLFAQSGFSSNQHNL